MFDLSNIKFRVLKETDEPILWEMLYQAIYVPEGSKPLSRDIVNLPEISRYVQDWGRSDDAGIIAIDKTNQKTIGAVWDRLLTGKNKGFGFVDDMTPELAIAVMPEYRGFGVGTKLLMKFLKELQLKYQAISLSVTSNNPAVRLYQRLGFETVEIIGDSITMVKRISP
jgi:ribosomal protein S18 acetylase RimI-like enzyme